MKHIQTNLIAVLALGGMMAFTAIANAQEAKPASPPAEKKVAAGKPSAEEIAKLDADIAKLEADLGLSPKLTAKIEALQKDQNARCEVVYQDASINKINQVMRCNSIVAETRKKIKALLTPEQYTKWEKLHEARKAFKAANKK